MASSWKLRPSSTETRIGVGWMVSRGVWTLSGVDEGAGEGGAVCASEGPAAHRRIAKSDPATGAIAAARIIAVIGRAPRLGTG